MKNISSFRKKTFLIFFFSHLLLILISVIYALTVSYAAAEGKEAVECYFKQSMYFYCPGCGGSRSLVYLLKFDLIKSFIYYPALPIAALLLLFADSLALISIIKDDSKYLKKFKLELLIIIPAVILLNFFIRNILLLLGIDYIGDFIQSSSL